MCDVSLSAREMSPTGRPLERKHPNYKAQIILGARGTDSMDDFEDLGVTRAELDSRPMDHAEVSGLLPESVRT